MKPIGRVTQSSYEEKFGAPRQSGLVQESKAIVTLDAWVQPEASLQGLSEFSHIWLFYSFHKNKTQTFKAKVSPPRLMCQKVGVFASRSPHRPNDIGLSVVRLERINKEKIYVSGVDFIKGTPVWDIKPYIAQVDRVEALGSG